VLAWAPDEPDAPLALPLFAVGLPPGELDDPGEAGFFASAPLPPAWRPGTLLRLHGPLGRGFSLPPVCRSLALAALDGDISCLLPLAGQALQAGSSVALFVRGPLPLLPPLVEVQPLEALPDALGWADFLALDLPLAGLSGLRQALGLPPERRALPCTAQVLVHTAMPCGGPAECGACAITVRRGWKLVCKDGPVFDIQELLE
jgi:hypothetical protein